jgi:transposase InsO family protein
MKQIARNLVNPMDGFLREAKYLTHDRDPRYTDAFIGILKSGGVKSVKIPVQSPNCNPHIERFIRTIRNECLDHLVLFGARHMQTVIKEFVVHYNTEQFHEGLGGQLIDSSNVPGNDNMLNCPILQRSRLGGLLNFYERAAT